MITILNKDDNRIVNFLETTRSTTNFIFRDVKELLQIIKLESAWGEFNKNNELSSLLLKSSFGHYLFYSLGDFDLNSYVHILAKEKSLILFGVKTAVEKFEEKLNFTTKEDAYFCKLDPKQFTPSSSLKGETIVPLTLSDKDDIKSLYSKMEDLNISDDIIDYMYDKQKGYGFGIKINNQLVCLAHGVADNELYAVISGVCTDPNFEGKGYATNCVSKLCEHYINEGKQLQLFYNNPIAGRIYNKLGFYECGVWRRYEY